MSPHISTQNWLFPILLYISYTDKIHCASVLILDDCQLICDYVSVTVVGVGNMNCAGVNMDDNIFKYVIWEPE